MAEVTYTAGYNIMSHIGKGKALMGLFVTIASTGDTITTPFTRCVPVMSPANGAGLADNVYALTEAAGVVSIAAAGTNGATEFQVIMIGDLY